jgi:hypothetical protein
LFEHGSEFREVLQTAALFAVQMPSRRRALQTWSRWRHARTSTVLVQLLHSAGIVMATLLPDDTALPGDLLITAERGRYLLSVIPQGPRIGFSDWLTAFDFAMRSSIETNADVWSACDGETVRVFRGRHHGQMTLRPTRDRRTALR